MAWLNAEAVLMKRSEESVRVKGDGAAWAISGRPAGPVVAVIGATERGRERDVTYLGPAVGQKEVRATLVLGGPRAVGDKLELHLHLLGLVLPPDGLMKKAREAKKRQGHKKERQSK